MTRQDSGSPTLEQVQALVERAGLTLTPEELESFRKAVELTQGQVRLLHSIDLKEEVPAFTFRPGDSSS